MRIKDPLTELLAIKLYEHDHRVWPMPAGNTQPAWLKLDNNMRDFYRQVARGEVSLPSTE